MNDYRIKCCPDGLVSNHNNTVKVLDCTIRDGGICNNWQFDKDTVKRVYTTLAQSGIDYMEIGYQTMDGLFDRESVGPWRFCQEDDLRDIVEEHSMKIATMVDIGRFDTKKLPNADDSSVDVLRIATYAHQMDQALEMLDDALEKGYETFMNVMAVSTLSPEKMDIFLHQLAGSGVHNVAIVDSFGAMYPYHIRYLVQKYRSILGSDIGLGVHCHNNQQQHVIPSRKPRCVRHGYLCLSCAHTTINHCCCIRHDGVATDCQTAISTITDRKRKTITSCINTIPVFSSGWTYRATAVITITIGQGACLGYLTTQLTSPRSKAILITICIPSRHG